MSDDGAAFGATVLPLAAAGDAMTRFCVTRLAVRDLRCYGEAMLEPGARAVVLTGANGAGKTNLLEALSLLGPGRGLRGADAAEIARRGAGEDAQRMWAVAADAAGPFGAMQISAALEPEPSDGARVRRVFRLNGAPVRDSSALTEALRVLWLTPAMDRLFAEGPGARRRFLDRLALGLDPAHATRAGAYERAMRERLKLLRESARPDPAWLAALEATMAGHGVALAAHRVETVARLAAEIAKRAMDSAFPAATIALSGTLEGWIAEGLSAAETEDRFQRALAAGRGRDADSGRTGTGPHLSDLTAIHAAKGEAAERCSTGEQKAIVIRLLLANAALMAASGPRAAPVLLLDEAAAHLDARRRQGLAEEIAALGAQAWLTGADASLFSDWRGSAAYAVEAGRVMPATL